MADLKALLKKAAGQYARRRAAAEAQVVRWEHFSSPAYDPKPLYFERALHAGVVKRGRPIKKPTARSCSYGLDARGRVVVDRQPKDADGAPAFEEFFVYDKAGGVESAAYGRDKPHRLRYVTRQIWKNGRPVSTDVLDSGATASFSERYAHKNGRLSDITVTSIAGKRKDVAEYSVVYRPDGALRAIRRHYDYLATPYLIYWNPDDGETIESVAARLKRILLDAIPRAVKQAKIKEPAYCLALVYDTENEELPPLIAVGLERERRAWLAEDARAAREMMWNPGEFQEYETGTIELEAPGLEEQSQILMQLILIKSALDVPQKLLNEVAAGLNKKSWKGVLPVTDDFIVYAIDLEGVDFSKNMKAGVPEAKRKRLQARRLL